MERPARVCLLSLPLAFLVGMLAVLATKPSPARPVAAAVNSEGDTEVVSSLLSTNDSLRLELQRLDRQLQSFQTADGTSRLEAMAAELNSLRIANGSAAVVGPGVEAVVRGQFSAASLRDLINELKNAGAEAIGVNGERLNLWSPIYEDENGVVVSGQVVVGMATIEAIGDPAVLKQTLERRGGLVSLLERNGASVTVSERSGAHEISLPICPETRIFRFARPAN